MASPSSVISLGYGSWGSVNLVPTLGFGSSEVLAPRVTYRPLHAALPPFYNPTASPSVPSYRPGSSVPPSTYRPIFAE